jgi:hypothetical protein
VLLKNLIISNFNLEVDALNVINLISYYLVIPHWSSSSILVDISFALSSVSFWSANHFVREANYLAHKLVGPIMVFGVNDFHLLDGHLYFPKFCG